MQQQIQSNQSPMVVLKGFFEKDDIKAKFQQLLGNKAQGFIASVLQIASSNKLLISADPSSIFNAAATAATLDLPINKDLGFAWIVPYKGAAQFQIGYKGFTQLALRTGQYLRINVVEVYQNQFKSFNALTEELDADFMQDGEGEILGYCAYFKLTNGFEKTTYWSKTKVINHAKKYSQSYMNEKAQSPWKDKDQFGSMAMKTVLKNTLSKWGILSIEMQKALTVDQGVINNHETMDVTYVDNVEEEITSDELRELLDLKMENLTKEEIINAERIISGNETTSFKKLQTLLQSK